MNISLSEIYKTLLDRYGEPRWWPANTPYEVIVGAILTQNTAWSNVEKAIAGFDELSPEFVTETDGAELARRIRPAGFYNQKAEYLKAVTAWFSEYDFDVSAVRRQPLQKVRAQLLSTKGVGPETADSILLYAFGFPTFVSDAYTIRLCSRYPLPAGKGYSSVKAYFEDNLPADAVIFNNFHALIVINGKEHCRSKPLCDSCPLGENCRRCGV
ncbi:MAG: endonuclease III domain-containing protein [Eubacteriales bacterium]|nr:endonuclease III domain-containing protein [Eubacteriales bacterium]